MKYENTPLEFYTRPSKGKSTSKYYIYEKGLIRAKFAAEEIHIRPGKNICYVKCDECDENFKVELSGDRRCMKVNDERVTCAEAMNPDGEYQAWEIGKRPVDFYADEDGKYRKKGFHYGHPICCKFKAKIGDRVVDEAKFDEFIKCVRVYAWARRA